VVLKFKILLRINNVVLHRLTPMIGLVMDVKSKDSRCEILRSMVRRIGRF